VSDSRTLLKHMKARLRERGMTYRELAKRLRVSEPTVKRDLSRGRFSLQRLDRICEVLDLTLEELLEPPTRASPLTELSAEQEKAIVSKPKLLLVAYLTANDWKFQEIVTTFQVSASELIDILLRLEKLGIAEFRPPNRVRKLTARVSGGARTGRCMSSSCGGWRRSSSAAASRDAATTCASSADC